MDSDDGATPTTTPAAGRKAVAAVAAAAAAAPPIAHFAAPGTMAHMAALESMPASAVKVTDRSKLGPTDETPVVTATAVKQDAHLAQKLTGVARKVPTAEELAEQERRKKDPKTIAELARLDRDLRMLEAADTAKNWKPYEPDAQAVEGLKKATNLFDFLNDIK